MGEPTSPADPFSTALDTDPMGRGRPQSQHDWGVPTNPRITMVSAIGRTKSAAQTWGRPCTRRRPVPPPPMSIPFRRGWPGGGAFIIAILSLPDDSRHSFNDRPVKVQLIKDQLTEFFTALWKVDNPPSPDGLDAAVESISLKRYRPRIYEHIRIFSSPDA